MDRALDRLPQLSLDPKRIAATSGAVALHVLVLLLLLLPAQTAPPIPVADNPMMVVVPEVKREIKLVPFMPMPPRPPVPVAKPSPLQALPESAPVDATPSAMDSYSPPVDSTPETSFD